MELVRVENHDGRIEVVAHDALQAKGDQDYFKAGLMLTVGRVHLSEFSLNVEHGKLEEPHRPTLRAVTTVFDANGHVFGIVVINKDVRSLFASASSGLPSGVQAYIVDQYRHYLLHPDAGRAFTFEENIDVDFPLLKPMFESLTAQNPPLTQTVKDGKGGYLAAKRVFFDVSDPARFLLLVYRMPAIAGVQNLKEISAPDFAETALVMVLVSAVFMLILRHTFAPLKRITIAAREIAAGNRDVRLKETGKGEIGKLAEALNMMLDKLSDSDQIKQESLFRKELIEALPGVFYMIDAQGRFLLWNRNLEQVLQLNSDELAASHPLDFFEGEGKVNIENTIRQVFAAGEASAEAELVAKDGAKTPYHFTGRRVTREGAPVLIGMGLDITEQRENLREAKALLRRNQTLMRNSMEGIHVMNVDGNLLEANDAFCNMLGYTREEIMHLNVTTWNKQFSGEELRERMKSRIGRSDMFETVHQRKDGSLLNVEICATGVELDGDLYVFASSRDITERKKVQSIQQRYKTVVAAAMDGYWMVNADGFLEEVNEAYSKMSGYTMEELVGMHITQLEANENEEEVKAHIDKLMAQGYGRFETRHRRKDGREVDVEVAVTYLAESGKFFVFSHNITLRKQAEQALRVAAATFEMHEAILITDAQANIIRVNSSFTDISGFSPEDVLGKNPRIMSSGRHDKAFYAVMWQQILDKGSWAGEIWDKRKNGDVYPKWMTVTAVKNQRGETTQYVAIFSDITERKRAEEEIRNLAFYDALTQLANRRLFMERFQTALAASARHGDHGAILFIDLDRFKQLNDSLGHDYGDLMLIEVAERLRSCVREVDTVARFGGDEFVVLLESISGDRQDASHKAGMVAEKIRELLSQPYQLNEHAYYCSPSIGVSMYHRNDESIETLLKFADAAMYKAKNAGRNNVRFFEPDLQKNWESTSGKPSREASD
jgi:diguanylate cyclase (GGDEF)-like protein/PAS domain S-box-containing protein